MSLNNSFSEIQNEKVQKIEAILQEYLPKQKGYQKLIMEAMAYSLLAGGRDFVLCLCRRPMSCSEEILVLSARLWRLLR